MKPVSTPHNELTQILRRSCFLNAIPNRLNLSAGVG